MYMFPTCFIDSILTGNLILKDPQRVECPGWKFAQGTSCPPTSQLLLHFCTDIVIPQNASWSTFFFHFSLSLHALLTTTMQPSLLGITEAPRQGVWQQAPDTSAIPRWASEPVLVLHQTCCQKPTTPIRKKGHLNWHFISLQTYSLHVNGTVAGEDGPCFHMCQHSPKTTEPTDYC